MHPTATSCPIGCACGWSLRGRGSLFESTIFPASSGRFTIFSGGSFWLKSSIYKVFKTKKTEIFYTPEMKAVEYNNIRHVLNDQKTLCWKKHRFLSRVWDWQAREFIFTAARLYIFCPGLWSMQEDDYSESFHLFLEWKIQYVSVVLNVDCKYHMYIYIDIWVYWKWVDRRVLEGARCTR